MEARFADEEVSAVFEPSEHFASQRFDFVVAQIHQKPVREDDVEFLVAGQLQLRHVGSQKIHVSVMPVAPAVLLHVVGHKVDCRQIFGVLRQMVRKSPVLIYINYLFSLNDINEYEPDSRSEFQNAASLNWW